METALPPPECCRLQLEPIFTHARSLAGGHKIYPESRGSSASRYSVRFPSLRARAGTWEKPCKGAQPCGTAVTKWPCSSANTKQGSRTNQDISGQSERV